MGLITDIRISGVSLQLPSNIDEEFFLTKQIHDVIKSLSTREGDFTRTIQLPNTALNAALTRARVPINFTRTSHDFVACKVILNGLDAINDAQLVVIGLNKNTITARIIGGNSGFYSQLKEASIKDLPLTQYNFEWLDPEIGDFRNASTGVLTGKYIFTDLLSLRRFEDAGGDVGLFRLQNMNLQWGGFWFYIDTLLGEIFDELDGLIVDRSGLDDHFKRLVMAVPLPRFLEAFDLPPGYRGFGSFTAVPTSIPQQAETQLIPLDFDDDNLIWNGTAWQIQEEGLCTTRVTVSGIGGDSLGNQRPDLIIKVNGVEIDSIVIGLPLSGPFNTGLLSSFPALVGDLVTFTILNRASVVTVTSMSQSVERAGANTSRAINVAEELPDISQKTFVINAFKWFNIVATERDGVVTLSYWDDIPKRPPALVAELALRDFEQTQTLTNYGRINHLEYADNDLIERVDANNQFTVESDVLDPEKVVIKLIFSATDINTFGGIEFCAPPAFGYDYERVDNNQIQTDNASNYSTLDANDLANGDIIKLADDSLHQVLSVVDNRNGTLVNNAGINNNQDWEFMHVFNNNNRGINVGVAADSASGIEYDDGAVPVGPFAAPRKDVLFSGLMLFGNILDTYFANFTRSIRSPAIILAWMDISVLQFVSLDQTKPIYIKSLAQNFYINKIEQFKPQGLVRMELLKV